VKKILISCLLLILLISNGNSFEIKLSKIVDLENPWGSTFINNDELLVTEKYGSIKLINLKNKKVTSINHNIDFLVDGQGGLLDILYKDEFVYVSYSEDRGSGKSSTSITKGKFNYQNINFKNIFRAEPPIKSGYHFGSRLAIKENTIFASSGERGGGMVAQDPSNHIGTIIRVNLDGSIPKDNPKFIDKPDWLPEIYQIGVRNPQGLTYSSFDEKIYASNHGARGGDWFGEIKKGENYGWKILGWGGTNYSGSEIGPKWMPGFTKAIKYWVPSIATSAIIIYEGKEFNEWKGQALITSLKDKSLRKLDFENLSDVKEEIIFKEKIGRIRDIQVHPVNGKLYFLSENGLWLMEKS
jgi:quinoprotein glucose dehydrogenase